MVDGPRGQLVLLPVVVELRLELVLILLHQVEVETAPVHLVKHVQLQHHAVLMMQLFG
jgi:hypothetical protein